MLRKPLEMGKTYDVTHGYTTWAMLTFRGHGAYLVLSVASPRQRIGRPRHLGNYDKMKIISHLLSSRPRILAR